MPSGNKAENLAHQRGVDGTIELFLHSSCDLAAITTPLKFSKGEELVWVNTGVNNTLIYLRLRPRDPAVPRIPYDLSVNVTRNAFDDAFEPNDGCAQLAPIATGRHTGLRSHSEDHDWYVVTVPRLGRMDFTLLPRTPEHNLELFVHSPEIPGAAGSCPGPILWFGRPDAQGNLVASFPERFGRQLHSLHVPSSVFTNDYDLDLRVDDRFAGNDSCGSGPLLESGGYSELAIDRNREDWFKVFVPAGGILAVDLETSNGDSPYPAMTLWRACGSLEAIAQDVDTPQGKRLFHINDGPDREMRLSVGLASISEATVLYRLQVSVESDCDRDRVPDRTELAEGDCNQNRIPDDCEPDLDRDGLPDDCIFTGPSFRRSDCNDDGAQDISDAVIMLGVLFLGSPPPPCREACNANDDDLFDISDAVYLLSHLFLGGSAPPQPFPACGFDSRPESTLGCGASACGQ